MATKKRVNLYLDAEIFDRSKVACDELGTSVSEYLSDYLRGNIDMLEVAASTKDPQKLAEVMQSGMMDILGRELAGLAESIHTIQADLKGVKKVS
jgi:hypothetical protein